MKFNMQSVKDALSSLVSKPKVVVAIAVAVVLLGFCHLVGAATVGTARQGADWIELTDQACTNPKVLAHVQEGMRENFRAGSAQLGGALYGLCWVQPDPAMIGVVYDDGDIGMVPAEMFR